MAPLLLLSSPATPPLSASRSDVSSSHPRAASAGLSMARGFSVRATLGLTKPSVAETPQITFSSKEIDVAEWKGDMLAVAVSDKDLSKDSDSKFANPILRKLDSSSAAFWPRLPPRRTLPGRPGNPRLGCPAWGSRGWAWSGSGHRNRPPAPPLRIGALARLWRQLKGCPGK
ncbi:leucine aminopeptidase 1-like [Iris pallida]|uniref:Leucine aminopeptidase 1-like n=1 Tax=Iris pallida TaxID=29817 RepID=A0AAX6EJC0_IRIPA|nr:leucine aminopeptidase 1-like [Iris pallida]